MLNIDNIMFFSEEGNEANFIKNFFSKCDYYREMCQHEIDESTTVMY